VGAYRSGRRLVDLVGREPAPPRLMASCGWHRRCPILAAALVEHQNLPYVRRIAQRKSSHLSEIAGLQRAGPARVPDAATFLRFARYIPEWESMI
jgi:hypothetical protein